MAKTYVIVVRPLLLPVCILHAYLLFASAQMERAEDAPSAQPVVMSGIVRIAWRPPHQQLKRKDPMASDPMAPPILDGGGRTSYRDHLRAVRERLESSAPPLTPSWFPGEWASSPIPAH